MFYQSHLFTRLIGLPLNLLPRVQNPRGEEGRHHSTAQYLHLGKSLLQPEGEVNATGPRLFVQGSTRRFPTVRS